jgi:hypothetical protein
MKKDPQIIVQFERLIPIESGLPFATLKMSRKHAKKSMKLADEPVQRLVSLATKRENFIQVRNRVTQKRRASKTWTPYPASAQAHGLSSEGFLDEVRIRQELNSPKNNDPGILRPTIA